MSELIINFQNNTHYSVKYEKNPNPTQSIAFSNPIKPESYQKILWYLETYSSYWSTLEDDVKAGKVEEGLKQWGGELFDAIFSDRAAGRLFDAFQEEKTEIDKVLTINSNDSEILSIPWEILYHPQEKIFLLNDKIAIRRGFSGIGAGRSALVIEEKPQLHLLFIISRPESTGFINPRLDSQAILEAIAEKAPNKITVEFLRPATRAALLARLDMDDAPIDILHFDGHGSFEKNIHANEHIKDDSNAKKGYLLFENQEGENDFISAEEFAEFLYRKKISLVILSACQSAKMDRDPMDSIAARLTHAGIPAVIAMTHSVLIYTTKLFFEQFYQQLAQNKKTNQALTYAKRYLKQHPERRQQWRSDGEATIALQDWFIISLYQTGQDIALLNKETVAENTPKKHNLPQIPLIQETGFIGRAVELWQIEKAFVNKAQRVTLSALGGQGKTSLAIEAGQWLLKTHMFDAVVFIDYTLYQGQDLVNYAITVINHVLAINASNTEDVIAALQKTNTLIILDNLEIFTDKNALLTTASKWSQKAKILLTTREANLNHSDYPIADSHYHQQLSLQGLQPQDALDYTKAIFYLPPKNSRIPESQALLKLYKKIHHHPLSISILAKALKTSDLKTIADNLDRYLLQYQGLEAVLKLVLEKIPTQYQKVLPRLGVLQGGGLEWAIMQLLGLDIEKDQDRATWYNLRDHLANTGLIQIKPLAEDYTYIQFHPTLAPLLWQQCLEQSRVIKAYIAIYYQLFNILYFEDDTQPHLARTIAPLELNNAIQAWQWALQENYENIVEFADSIDIFLDIFGWKQDSVFLQQQLAGLSLEGRQQYLRLKNQAQQFFQQGQYQQAKAKGLEALVLAKEYDYALMSVFIGRCCRFLGEFQLALSYFQQALTMLESLEATESTQRLESSIYTEMGDVYSDQHAFTAAETAYQKSLEIDEKIGDLRGQTVIRLQLGTLYYSQQAYIKALTQYQEALAAFGQLQEPQTQAIAYHQIGMVYNQMQNYNEAEKACRQAIVLKEQFNNYVGAATSYAQLAQVLANQGQWAEAETWYKKAIVIGKDSNDQQNLSKSLSHLAYFLSQQETRLPEAYSLAQQALEVSKDLDPTVVYIWVIYHLLAITCPNPQQAETYQTLAQESYREHAGELKAIEIQWARPLIEGIFNADIEEKLQVLKEQGEEEEKLAMALEKFRQGERDYQVLVVGLDYQAAFIIYTLLDL